MNCDEALKIMLDQTHTDRQTALNYIRNNPDCLLRVDQLARAVVSKLENELSCSEARVQMADYYTQSLSSGDEATAYPYLHNHLARCPYCQQDYDALKAANSAVLEDALPTIDPLPRFDLSFIDKPLPPMRPTSEIWDVVADAAQNVRKLFRQVDVTIREGVADVGAITAQLQPVRLVPVTRSSSGIEQVQSAAFSLPDEEVGIYFHIDTQPSVDNTALLTLHVRNTETDDPIPEVRITMSTAAGDLVAEAMTDKYGAVEFPRLTANEYTIQAQYEDAIWEIPVAVISSLQQG